MPRTQLVSIMLLPILGALGSMSCGGGEAGGAPGEDGGSGGGSGSVTPVAGELCSPCAVSADCKGEARCLVHPNTGERFCGADCTNDPCPAGTRCHTISAADGPDVRQCVPPGDTCEGFGTDGGDGGSRPGTTNPPPPPPPTGDCDPDFLGPFCTGQECDASGDCSLGGWGDRIIGFDEPAPENPTIEQAREYSLKAVNHLRARTCLPPLVLDDCLNEIAEEALAANRSHGYFIDHCMNQARGFGRNCECNWTQENIGAAAASGQTWVHGVHRPLCGMMTEPKGVGHRANIEHPHWVRLGVAINVSSIGATWFHEFGCDATLSSCPK